MTRTKDIIKHYGKCILNENTSRERLLHCINKLYALDITVQHLQETGIGKAVHKLRGKPGELGTAASALIAKWKTMVATELSNSDSETERKSDDDKSPPPHKDHHRGEKDRKDEENIQKSRDSAPPSKQKDHSEVGERHHHKHHSSRQRSSGDKSHSKSDGDKHHSKGHHKNKTETSSTANSLCHLNGSDGTTDDGDDEEENRLIIDIKVKEGKHNKHHRNDRKDEKRMSGGEERRSDTHKSSRNSEKNHHKSNGKIDHHKSSRDKHNEKSSHEHRHKIDSKSVSSNGTHKRKRESDEYSPDKSALNGHVSSSKAKKPKAETAVDEIDSSMGTSFADALGMMMPTLSKTSKQKNCTKSTTKLNVPSKDSIPSPPGSEQKSKDVPTKPPKLLSSSVKLPPLEPVIAVDFPIISNDYKPMPLNATVMDCVFNNKNQQKPKRLMTDEEAFGSGISSKTMRTKVYSGVKSGAVAQIPTLYQICIRTLQKNIDGLEQIGFIPFEILKPVLELASPQQLCTIEDYNPHMMDDTDGLWEFHCNRKFRTQKRRGFETWRDMFLRCSEEQEARLNSLTNNIKRSQTVAIPLKTTKLAYVNSPVKPPRGIIKKQNQYGTEKKLVATPAARVATLNEMTANIAKPGDVRLRVAAGLRDTAQVASNPTIRPKKAPLMAKTLKSIRSRFKR